MATQEAIVVDPLSTVHRYIDAFNEGDVKGMAALLPLRAQFWTGCRHTCGTARRQPRIGTGTS
jgi:hypothetical protein